MAFTLPVAGYGPPTSGLRIHQRSRWAERPVARSAREAREDHLRMRREGDLDADLEHNSHPDVVVLTAKEVVRGHDGVRSSAHALWQVVGDAHGDVYDTVMVEDRFGRLRRDAQRARHARPVEQGRPHADARAHRPWTWIPTVRGPRRGAPEKPRA